MQIIITFGCLTTPALTGGPTAPMPGGPCGPGGPIPPFGPYEFKEIHEGRTEGRSDVCYSLIITVIVNLPSAPRVPLALLVPVALQYPVGDI